MRYSAWLVATALCMKLPLGYAPDHAVPAAYACGFLPAGWTPPWQRKPTAPSRTDAPCHLMLCDRKKPGARAGECGPF
ncbi:MAG: hypothetical protein QM605_12355 [Sphingobium sp.]